MEENLKVIQGEQLLTGSKGNIVAALNVEASDLLDFLIGQFDFLEVLLDAGCRDRFWDDAVSANLSPGDPSHEHK